MMVVSLIEQDKKDEINIDVILDPPDDSSYTYEDRTDYIQNKLMPWFVQLRVAGKLVKGKKTIKSWD